MVQDYEEKSKLMKALSDPNRLKLVDLLSCGERCVCDLQEYFELSQPTLSHHLKVLMECGLVSSRKEGLWNFYFLQDKECNKLVLFLMNLITDTEDCECRERPMMTCKGD